MSNELKTMNANNELALNNMLRDLEKSGAIKVAELRPSLGALLTDEKNGGFVGRAFLGEIVGFQKDVDMPSMDDKDDVHQVDILELKDASGDFNGETFAFNAGNGGLKAKVAKVKDGKFALIFYRGEMEPTKKGWNPAKDYGIIGGQGADGLQALTAFYAKAKSLYPKK